MRFLKSIVLLTLGMLLADGCSDSTPDRSAGIEIGNPSSPQQADQDTALAPDTSTGIPVHPVKPDSDVVVIPVPVLSMTADFSVEYGEPSRTILSKSQKEPILIDEFSLELEQIRSFSSYYVAVSFDPTDGLLLWPYEDSPDTSLTIPFADGASVAEPFSRIDLKDEGTLKELGVGFRPRNSKSVISGRALIDGRYVPFEYSLSMFQSFMLRYHFNQVEWISDSLINLSVEFYVRNFVAGIDFSLAEVSLNGVIYFNKETNVEQWNKLNARFLPSFRSLRYEYVDLQANHVEDYVLEFWDALVGEMSDNTIANGNFADSLSEWIFFTQLGGDARATILTDKKNGNMLKVEVLRGGSKSYSVQLIQENVALVKNIKYKCVFTIWSDVPGEITARIGSYDNYETIGFQEHVKVKTSGQSFEMEFTPSESTPFARFELNLGNGERIFYIKDVQIYRLEN